MAIEIERPRKFTADEFERMVVANLNKRLVTGVGDRALVWVQGPARLAIDSVPEPDLALLRSHSYRRGAPRPDDVLLVVEVAESSLRYDQTVKLPLYAGAGVPEYWIVSVEGEWIEVCRSPAGESICTDISTPRMGWHRVRRGSARCRKFYLPKW